MTFDWFEDSLQSRRKKQEARYDVAKASKAKRKDKKEKQRKRNEVIDKHLTRHANLVSDARAKYNVHGYSIYFDPTGFVYDITLLCGDALRGRHEKVVLRLYTSDEPPYYYAAFSTYFGPDGQEARRVLAPLASSFPTAFEAFKKHFESRTKYTWANRVQAGRPTLLKDGSVDPLAYRYKFPAFGPAGMDLPPGRYDPSQPVDDDDVELMDNFAKPDVVAERDHASVDVDSQGDEVAFENSDDEQYDTADEGEEPGAMHWDVSGFLEPKTASGLDRLQAADHAAERGNDHDVNGFGGPIPAFGYQPVSDYGVVQDNHSYGQNVRLPSPPSFQYASEGVKEDYEGDGINNPGSQNLDAKGGIVNWDWSGR